MVKRKKKQTRNPRVLAVEVVTATFAGQGWAEERLETARAAGQLDARDMALARQIVMGTIRHKLTLDCILGSFSTRPVRRIQPRALNILRTGLYQILYLDRVPASAATDEAVSLAGARAAGFVNAVLRSTLRALVHEPCDDPTRCLSTPSRPLSFREPVFPHPKDDLVGHLSVLYSHPASLVQLLLDAYDEETARGIMAAAGQTPPFFVRANTLRTTVDTLRKELTEAGLECQGTAWADLLSLRSAANLFGLPAFLEGRLVVQDGSAAQVAPLLGPAPGETVLDMCAAPGGKTAHLAQLMEDQGELVAYDLDTDRMDRLNETVRRLGLTSVSVRRGDMQKPADDLLGRFDKVLVDAPCSNSGVLARRPEARYRIEPAGLERLARLQGRLLKSAAACLAPGGAIVYGTCSVLPRENRQVVDTFVEKHPEFRVVEEIKAVPTTVQKGDGLYACRLERS